MKQEEVALVILQMVAQKSDGLRDWVKQDWRQVANPDKKCGED